MRFDNAPEGGVLSALFQPYLMSLWPLVRIFIDPIETAFLMKNIIKGSNAGLIAAAYCIMASFIGIVSYLLLRMGKYFKQKKWNNKFRWFFFSKLPFIQFFMLLSMIMIGTVSTFFLNAFYSPLVPVQEGHYIPALTFNGIALAYGAATLVGHTIFSCAFACATFVNAIPTPVMGIIVLIGGLKIIKRKDEKNNNKIIYLDILSILSLIMILFYGLFQIPLIPRYMNLFLLLFTVTGISGISFVNIKEKTHKYLLLCAWIAVFVIEVIPFRPGLVTFRPLWSNLSEEFNNDPSFGRNPPWYTGWGEEVKLAGERIHNMYKDSLLSGEKIRVFHNYPGSWIRNPEEIELVHMVPGFDSYEYGDRCFYLFTRAGVSFSNIPFPYNIQPIFTIDDRGFVKVWVFRAKDIREAGIKFAPNVPDSK